MSDPRAGDWSRRTGSETVLLRPAPQVVRKLFNDTAAHYDTLNHIFSLGSGGWYRRRCLTRAGLKPGQRLLDVAIGTGLVAVCAKAIVGSAGEVIGLDLSEAMLAEARRKLDIPLIQGMAAALPLADTSIDFIAMGYALRYIDDLEACLREFRRVLRPGGTLLLLEISHPTKTIYRTTLARYLGYAVPLLGRWITGRPTLRTLMTYHWETMAGGGAREAVESSMAQAGFTEILCETWFDVFRSYVGRRP